jgi:threonine aldolase
MINLYSDTQTRPTEAMRAAMASAEVGDEQRREDPTVIALEERVAKLLGQEAAVFLPSGTMCNAISVRLHIRPGGDELLLGEYGHPLVAEAGGPAAISGAVLTVLDSEPGRPGIFSADTLRSALGGNSPGGNRYAPRPRLVSVEQPVNLGGGLVWPARQMLEILDAAAEHGLRSHLDGARLMNAVVASGVAASAYAEGFDTAWIDFTKGLGAPVGACLAASADLISEAWRYKQMWGGAMRQAGVIAAAGLYALDHHVERLADDHANARFLAEGLAELPGVELDPAAVESNIVIFTVPDPGGFVDALARAGVQVSRVGPTLIRMVTHLDVDRAGCERALAAARQALGS